LVDIEQASLGHHRIVRVYLDKPGGVSIDDCARFSRRLADAMDMNQIVPGDITSR
jgi:ribosome maturation factor RimP